MSDLLTIKRAPAPVLAMVASLLVSGCGILEPKLPEADAGVPAQWPLPPTTAMAATPGAVAAQEFAQARAADIGWRDFFVDSRLEDLIARALENNRDLRAAVLNVERARAAYRIQRADRLPSVGINGTMTRIGGDGRSPSNEFTASVGIVDFELDLFGRVRNLSQAALQQYFAQEEARRSAQLSLVAEIANAYLTLIADQELQRVARDALINRQQALNLTEKRYELGAVSALDLSQAQTSVETARTDLSRYAGFVAQDINALSLLVGAPVEATLLPTRFELQVSGLSPLPANLPSEVLLRRPDVLQAEYVLRSANASIGAARAAFFPSISLTGAVGHASDELSDLFESGTKFWSFSPQVNLPIFQGGRLRGGLGVATVDRDIALARYERSIQAGFREVADALALTRTLAEQKASQEALVAAATRVEELSRARYEAGSDSYLVLLDAQRTLYSAQQSLIATQLAEQSNRVVLYKVLGGGWNENSI